jgi:hypothetical protein
MTQNDQRSAERMLHAAVDQLLNDDDPLTCLRQLDEFNEAAIPYVRAARRAAVYRAKTRGQGMSWGALAEAMGVRENNVRRIVARHCRETGDPWPKRAGLERRRPPNAIDMRGL